MTSLLPPVEETPLLAIRFTSKASEYLQKLVEQRLVQAGFHVLERASTPRGTVLSLTTFQSTLERQAQISHLMKRTYDTGIIDAFTVASRERFCDVTQPYRDKLGLFTNSERSMLISHMINNVTVLPSGTDESDLSRTLDSVYRAEIHHGNPVVNDATASQRKRLQEHGTQSEGLQHVLQTYGLVDAFMLVHLPMKLKQEIVNKTWWPLRQINPPIDLIQSHYGCEVGFYFAWMGFLTQWYFVPGILGFTVFILRRLRGNTVDEDQLIPIYGSLGFLWAILFLRFWDRYEHRLAHQWGTYALSPYERQKFFAFRPEFKGYLRYSPVTGEPETYYPAFYRRLKYVAGAAITVVMLAFAFGLMILSLNLQGYIRPSSNPRRWDENKPHPFHFPSFAVLAEEGRVFDAASTWRCFIPVIIHVVGINLLNGLYRTVAEWLTDWENHETRVNHRNSLILKRFLFEAFDCYVALVYLAFYERNVERLRMELMAVLQIDTLRRLAMECIIPLVLYRLRTRDLHRRPSVSSPKANTPTMDEVLRDLEKDEYEQFDDYMEILIQLGYVSLFASAYPLAALVSIAANWVEIRADCYRLTLLCRRPTAYRTQGMAMWRDLMAAIIWMSALTNSLLMGFSSDQLMYYMPEFYIQDAVYGHTDMAHEKSWILVFVIFGIERFLLVVGLLLHTIIPEVPEDVQNSLEKAHYEHMKIEMSIGARLQKLPRKQQSNPDVYSPELSLDFPQLRNDNTKKTR